MNNSKSFSDLFDDWIVEKSKEESSEIIYNAIDNMGNVEQKVYTKPSSFYGTHEFIVEEEIIEMEVGFASLDEFFAYLKTR